MAFLAFRGLYFRACWRDRFAIRARSMTRVVRDRTGMLVQLRVLRLGLLQDGDVGVGVFPEREEIFVGGERRTRAALD